MTQNNELLPLPCPFCGASGHFYPWSETMPYRVRCGECDASGGWCNTRELAVSVWNTRAQAASGDVETIKAIAFGDGYNKGYTEATLPTPAQGGVEMEIAGTVDGLPRILRRAYVVSCGNWQEVAKAAIAAHQPVAGEDISFEDFMGLCKKFGIKLEVEPAANGEVGEDVMAIMEEAFCRTGLPSDMSKLDWRHRLIYVHDALRDAGLLRSA